ncbi:MAG: dephospho-CoA kinase [Helicobacter trogontum]|uniref:Dephospho-CoA kinase n=1 Tax=Helicobacter trogontum TaxID=50960 RepID=A0A4U8TDV5_9HELI|nr:dephospho-CoA kinase [Helicobacter trogontum]MCI5787623.1 dephospho-CoA kinase [Helicobacter trogontum]TLD98210.1 dephospho-CoA kinase [Helicobacter trogontum]
MYYANILTGGIGCGKSTTARLLALHGFRIVDVDTIAHKALEIARDNVVSVFGDEILETSNKERYISREKLGNIVFKDSNKKIELESILHPLIHQHITQECEILEKKKSPYFIDIPLYFESKYEYKKRFVICVYATRDMQIQRIQSRNNLSLEDIIKRVDSQIDIETKRRKSDFVIENTSDLKTLQSNIESFLQEFLGHY